MAWVIIAAILLGGLYLLGRGQNEKEASFNPPPGPGSSSRAPSARSSGPGTVAKRVGRAPAYTRDRVSSTAAEPERWRSEGREIPFVEGGLKGPLFRYGSSSA
jgi:hypothetical protein